MGRGVCDRVEWWHVFAPAGIYALTSTAVADDGDVVLPVLG
jgi:hypothetical protein